uniref:Uncharacterized protein n=1 Tax=Anguilla anguilla TaxID=7936 RepID=A0A0E9XRB8_ANGAN
MIFTFIAYTVILEGGNQFGEQCMLYIYILHSKYIFCCKSSCISLFILVDIV